MEQVYTIGGKEFSPIDFAQRTVRQDHFLVAMFRRTGVDKINPVVDEDPKEFLQRMFQRLVSSGLACEVLSGFLLPRGMKNADWRKETAAIVQQHLEGCSTEEDRLLVNQLAFDAMSGFLLQGLNSLLNIQKLLLEKENEATRKSPRIEESSGTKPGTGRRLSASLRDTILRKLRGSSTGHLGN
jgi:hypothetical protein